MMTTVQWLRGQMCIRDRDNAEAFLKRIDKGKVYELMTLPIRREESAYSIVSGAAIKRILFRSFVPYPIRYIWTCYQALGYILSLIHI